MFIYCCNVHYGKMYTQDSKSQILSSQIKLSVIISKATQNEHSWFTVMKTQYRLCKLFLLFLLEKTKKKNNPTV